MKLRIHGIAAKDDGAPVCEVERFLDDVLYRQLVSAAADGVSAEDVHATLVEPVGAQGARSVERYVVSALPVHDDAQCGIRGCVDKEVEMDISGNVVVCLSGLSLQRVVGSGECIT